MGKPLLVMFVGGPGSGKTTFSRLLADRLQAIVLNSDAARVSMWGSKDAVRRAHTDPSERSYGNRLTFGALDYAACQILLASHSVIYDANANKPDERTKLARIAYEYDAIPIVVRIKTDLDVAVQRIVDRVDQHDQNQHGKEHAAEIVEKFHRAIIEPTSDENSVEINGEADFENQYAQFLHGIEQYKSL